MAATPPPPPSTTGRIEIPARMAPIYAMFASSLSPYADDGIGPSSNGHGGLFANQPDLAVTVRSRSRQDRFNLCRRLMTDQRWRATIIAPDALLVTLDPTDLHAFHHVFQGEEIVVWPPAAREPGYGQPKRRLAAVVVLR